MDIRPKSNVPDMRHQPLRVGDKGKTSGLVGQDLVEAGESHVIGAIVQMAFSPEQPNARACACLFEHIRTLQEAALLDALSELGEGRRLDEDGQQTVMAEIKAEIKEEAIERYTQAKRWLKNQHLDEQTLKNKILAAEMSRGLFHALTIRLDWFDDRAGERFTKLLNNIAIVINAFNAGELDPNVGASASPRFNKIVFDGCRE